MHRRTILLAALVLLPVGTAAAQRTSSRATKRDSVTFADDNMAKGPAIRGRDLEDLNPIRLLIDKRKDLKLSDAQIDGLKKSETQLKEKNTPLFKAIDSLAREMKPPMNRTTESDARIRDAQHDLEHTLSSIRESYDAASKDAIAGFDADQQKKAGDLFARLKEDTDKRIREKMKNG